MSERLDWALMGQRPGGRQQQLVRAAAGALPAGAAPVGAGLVILGMTSYGFLAVAARMLTPPEFATLSVLWVLVYTVGPGVFLPFEQEVGRALSDRRARGLGGGPLLGRAAALGLGVLIVLAVATLLAGPALRAHLFDGSWLMFAALVISLFGLWAAHLSRGAFAGNARFGWYGGQLAVEGLSRLGLCLLLALGAVHRPGAYGLLVGGVFLISAMATAPGLHGLVTPGPDARWEELTGALGWLLGGALLSQALVNAAPVAVKLLATADQRGAAGTLLAALVLARLPLFLFAAVQAALLPRLAGLVGGGRRRLFRSSVRRLLAGVAVVGVANTIAMSVLGPPLVRYVFGERFHMAGGDLARLSAATGLYMAANVLSNALLALRRYRLALVGYAAGVSALIVVTALASSLFLRVELGFLAGTLASAATLGWLYRTALRLLPGADATVGPVDLPQMQP